MDLTNQNQPLSATPDDSSLESQPAETVPSSGSESLDLTQNGNPTTPLAAGSVPTGGLPPPKDSWLQRLFARSNIYLVSFVGLLLLAAIIVGVAFLLAHKNNSTTVQTQALTKQTLQQLADSDVSVGQPKQVLNVQSNAVFAGQVLVRSDLDVAGKLQVGSGLDLPDVNVANTATLGSTQVQKNLSVAGDSAVQGQLNVQKNLTVAGGGNFGGTVSVPQLTAASFQLNSDLAISHHIVSGGATPSRSGGSGLGSGGSASISGSDTAGTANINTGSGAAAGCFVSVAFTAKYNATPHVLVTPVGSAAGNIGYYISRSSTGFSICANNPPSGASFSFDYFVIG